MSGICLGLTRPGREIRLNRQVKHPPPNSGDGSAWAYRNDVALGIVNEGSFERDDLEGAFAQRTPRPIEILRAVRTLTAQDTCKGTRVCINTSPAATGSVGVLVGEATTGGLHDRPWFRTGSGQTAYVAGRRGLPFSSTSPAQFA